MTWVLGGGEDHAIAATFAVGDVPEDWQVIGRVLTGEEQSEPTVLVDGRPWEHQAGWTHF